MLEDKVIAITRDKDSARHFVNMVESSNGRVISLPTISLIPKNADVILSFLDMLKAKNYNYSLFMSASAVNIMFDVFERKQKTEDAILELNHTSVVAVGPNTKQALENHHVAVAMMPAKYSSYGVLDLFSKENTMNKSMIIPRSSASTNYLAKSLSDMGMIVDELHVYDVKPAEHGRWMEFMRMLIAHKIDCMVFTSASSVNSFFETAITYKDVQRLREMLNSINVIAIGPFTNNALVGHAVEAVVAEEHTVKGTFDVALKLLGKR